MEGVIPTSFLVSRKVSSTQRFTFRPVCCLSYAMIDIDPWETLISVILPSTAVPCSSLCIIILYGGSLLSSSSRINQSQATCMALWWDLVDFTPLWIYLRSHHGRLESLVVTCTYLCWKHSDPHLRRQYFLQWMVKSHLLEDDVLTKLQLPRCLGCPHL